MSYEGTHELLCAKGHYYAHDVYDLRPLCCPFCSAPWAYIHMIDETNGADESQPDTLPAPLTEIGFDDVWHTDHYNNRYATKRTRYTPTKEWRQLTDEL